MPYAGLGVMPLKSGEEAALGVATGPTPAWQRPLCAFLNSPPRPDGPSLYAFLLGEQVRGLESRFFFVHRNGEILGCVVATDNASEGYINSTFVRREYRRLGIASSLMSALEHDFAGRGGKVRFLTTRTGSPAESLFRRFGYRIRYERDGRTGMEKHYSGATWDELLSADPTDLRIENMTWAHWVPHRALMWNRPPGAYRAIAGDFLGLIRGTAGGGRTVWKALVTSDGRLIGDAALRPHVRWGDGPAVEGYLLDMHVHPPFLGAAESLFDAVMPSTGLVQTFLDGSSERLIAFFLRQGFGLDTSLRDDFHHHDPAALDIRIYSKYT